MNPQSQKQQDAVSEPQEQHSEKTADAQKVDSSLKAAVQQNAAELDDRSTTKTSDPSKKE
jgi:hypothetical protein